jgi:hypothetical protein
MTVLWDPYQPKSSNDEDHHTDSDIKDDNVDNHHHNNADDDVAFTAPENWEYVYDIEVWHKKAVMHAW